MVGTDIRFLAMDVDGTLTDGKIYMGPDGEALKAFDVKDGYAIKCMLPKMGIVPVIITARESTMLEQRCHELGVEELRQGAQRKLDELNEVLVAWGDRRGIAFTLANVAYIGDDIPDLECMRAVSRAGGLSACPLDSASEIRSICDFVCTKEGGRGAIRELVEHIASLRRV